jgi:sugar O-acyltransferase (sialic acid O-acetyltransferase NeuD family)
LKKTIYAVYGSSGCGRGVMPLAKDQLDALGINLDQLFFLDDYNSTDIINGCKVLDFKSFLEIDASDKYVSIAISDSNIRERLKKRLTDNGIKLWSLKANNVVIMDNVEIAEGGILSPFVSLTSNISIGLCFQANLYSYIEHDSIIGDYVTFAPGVKCNGNVIVGNHVYIGSGAIIKQGTLKKPLRIGERSIVGMGAVVINDVPAGATVVGNPAKVIKLGS